VWIVQVAHGVAHSLVHSTDALLNRSIDEAIHYTAWSEPNGVYNT
jgi:hypothetical protein